MRGAKQSLVGYPLLFLLTWGVSRFLEFALLSSAHLSPLLLSSLPLLTGLGFGILFAIVVVVRSASRNAKASWRAAVFTVCSQLIVMGYLLGVAVNLINAYAMHLPTHFKLLFDLLAAQPVLLSVLEVAGVVVGLVFCVLIWRAVLRNLRGSDEHSVLSAKKLDAVGGSDAGEVLVSRRSSLSSLAPSLFDGYADANDRGEDKSEHGSADDEPASPPVTPEVTGARSRSVSPMPLGPGGSPATSPRHVVQGEPLDHKAEGLDAPADPQSRVDSILDWLELGGFKGVVRPAQFEKTIDSFWNDDFCQTLSIRADEREAFNKPYHLFRESMDQKIALQKDSRFPFTDVIEQLMRVAKLVPTSSDNEQLRVVHFFASHCQDYFLEEHGYPDSGVFSAASAQA